MGLPPALSIISPEGWHWRDHYRPRRFTFGGAGPQDDLVSISNPDFPPQRQATASRVFRAPSDDLRSPPSRPDENARCFERPCAPSPENNASWQGSQSRPLSLPSPSRPPGLEQRLAHVLASTDPSSSTPQRCYRPSTSASPSTPL